MASLPGSHEKSSAAHRPESAGQAWASELGLFGAESPRDGELGRDGLGDGGSGGGEPAEIEVEVEIEVEPLDELVVDPLSRALAQAGPRFAAPPAEIREPVMVAHPELEQLMTKLVRRIAFGGDGRRGTARLELGAGPLEGATLLVSAESGELTIDLELPPGACADEWRTRLGARLAARGLSVRELTVR